MKCSITFGLLLILWGTSLSLHGQLPPTKEVHNQEKALSILKNITVKKNVLTIVPADYLKEMFLKGNNFVVTYDRDISSLPISVLMIPYIMCMSPLIWLSGKNYIIDEIDYDTYHALEKIKKVFKLFYPQLKWNGTLSAKHYFKNRSPQLKDPDHIGLLFSGGLDCVSSSLGHYGKHQLLITNQGVDMPLSNTIMWEAVQKQCQTFAEEHDHANAFISFNFCSIVNYSYLKEFSPDITKWWWLDSVVDALNHAGVTAPILYAEGYSRLFIAASHTKEFPYPYGSHPLIDNSIAFAGVTVHHDQESMDRCQKIELVQLATEHLEHSVPALRVCWTTKDGTNCLSCEKCLRTLNNILVTGNDPTSYGFILSTDEIIQRTREFLVKDPIKDGKIFWEWSVIKRRAEDYSNTDNKLTEYFKWLSNVTLDGQHAKKIHAQDEEKAYFTLLWEKSL